MRVRVLSSKSRISGSRVVAAGMDLIAACVEQTLSGDQCFGRCLLMLPEIAILIHHTLMDLVSKLLMLADGFAHGVAAALTVVSVGTLACLPAVESKNAFRSWVTLSRHCKWSTRHAAIRANSAYWGAGLGPAKSSTL